MTETHIGLIVLGVPALLIGGIILGRWRPVLWFYVAALIVGLGYLTTTGAVDDVGKSVIEAIAAEPEDEAPAAAPEPAPSVAPEPAPEAAPEPAPAPETPPAPEAPSSPETPSAPAP